MSLSHLCLKKSLLYFFSLLVVASPPLIHHHNIRFLLFSFFRVCSSLFLTYLVFLLVQIFDLTSNLSQVSFCFIFTWILQLFTKILFKHQYKYRYVDLFSNPCLTWIRQVFLYLSFFYVCVFFCCLWRLIFVIILLLIFCDRKWRFYLEMTWFKYGKLGIIISYYKNITL